MEITTASKNKSNSRGSSHSNRNSISDFSDDLLAHDSEHKKSSFRSFQSLSSSESLTMAIPKTSKPCRSRKVAMVVKKQPISQLESEAADLEGELKDFLIKQKYTVVPTTKPVDDGTTSTTSRTTNSNSNNKDKDNGKIEDSLRTNTTAASSRDNSLKDSDLTQWDWSHHSADWIDFQSSSQHGFEQSFAEFPDLREDERLHTLNDSIHESPRKPRSSRRIQRQQEFQHALNQSFNNGEMQRHRRLGEDTMKRPSTTRPRRGSLKTRGLIEDFVAPPPTMVESMAAQQQQRRKSGTSSRRGSRTTRDKSLDRVRGKSRDKSRNSSRDEPRESRRIRSKSSEKAHEMPRSVSRDEPRRRNRSGSPLPRNRSTSRDKSTGQSPRPRRGSRRMSGSHQVPQSPVPEPIPFSSGSRRGRRRSSNGGNAAAMAALELDRLNQSERGRPRGSMSNVATSNSTHETEHRQKHKQQQRRRGSSLTARVARRRSLDTSYHSLTSNGTNDLTEKSSRHRRRSRSRSNRSPTKSMDRSSRSHRSDELLPQRLSNLLGRGNNGSQLEKLALQLLLAEDDNDLDLDAVEKVPTHMLDPSKVPLNIKW